MRSFAITGYITTDFWMKKVEDDEHRPRTLAEQREVIFNEMKKICRPTDE